MPASASSSIHSTTQEFIDIFDITNDLVIMKDGSTALVLTVDAMNFGLLAEEEQDAIMYAYAGLLNSLNYSIQIVIRSQTKDATNYLNLLKDQAETASSAPKRAFINEYREFVANLIRERNVLDKKFYIAIPATALEMGLMPPSTVIPGVKKTDISTLERSVILDKAKTILEPKRDHLISQFGRIGLYARQLQTQEIIQLFYTSYNPEAAEGQQITDTRNYVTPLVQAATSSSYNSAPAGATVTAPEVVTPATPYGGTDNLAPLLPNQPNAIKADLQNSSQIYQEPPALVEIPVPVDARAEMNQAAIASAPAAAKPEPTPTPAEAPTVPQPAAPTSQETSIYSAATMPPAPMPNPPPVMPPPSFLANTAPVAPNVPATSTLPPPATLPPIPEIQ